MARLPQLTTVIAVALSLSSCSIVSSPGSDGTFELLIIHNNDMHARFEQTSQLSGACTTADRDAGKCYGGFPRVATVVKEARKAAASGQGPPVLYLNAGDTYTGTAWFTIYKWKIAAEFLNALEPDAVCLGNHEFDEQVDGLLPFIRNLTSPVLAANLILDEVPLLEAETNLYKSIILQKNGVQIGVIGYVTPDTKFLAPKNKVKYEDEIPALRREVNKLKSHDVNIVIALGHSGFIKDLEIAAEVDGIDLVIGGHSNTFLTNKNTSEIPEFRQGAYPTTVIQKSGRKTLVVQAYAYTKYMGKLHLLFNDAGDIIDFNGEPILLNDLVPKEPEVLEIVNKYRGEVNRINNKIVGTSSVLLNGESCRLFECNLGNVMTDAMLDYTKRHAGFADVNIAVIQGGRIRSSINRSEKPFLLTRGDWINVMPFTDTLCIVSMNGSVLLKALEHSVDSWRRVDTPGQFLQASGLEVVYDLANLPGNRVVSAKSMYVDCDKVSDVRDDLQYKVIMSTFLSEGGDGYSIFENLEKEVLTYGEITCILDYLSKYSPIDPDIDGRIKVLNEDKVNDIYIIEPVNVGMPDRFLPSSTDKSQSTLEVIILSIVVSISCLCHIA
ncbi:protein 5NUC-like isoform X2 [Leptidea sinapis]|uniref:protein 5NUC-like isoform X1 n=1 Tax=Leptidea sinapis TaxID=189913 RepID=UPI0021C2AC2B|nr:protein 5NUC-like isoform X1 [Leptidea sinapis]XP_050665741.1 protein 5NUC-like isoform X2 [Leptidea sinapis]